MLQNLSSAAVVIGALRANELVSSIRYKLACVYSEDSNQFAHPQSDQSLNFPS